MLTFKASTMPDIVFMFAGQGSQYFNMGADLFHSNVYFRNTLLNLDREVRSLTGISVVDHIYARRFDADGIFDDLRYSNPGLFMVQYALARVLQDELQVNPTYVLGTNIGEMVAAVVSEAVPVSDMLHTIIEQDRIIERMCERGGLINVRAVVSLYETEPLLYENTTLVGTCKNESFTLSADDRTLLAVKFWLESHQITYSQLPVRYPFHSPLLDPIRDPILRTLRKLDFSMPAVTFMSGAHAMPIPQLNGAYFWDALRAPSLFTDAIALLEGVGPCFYIDCSPSGECNHLLNGALSSISASIRHEIMSPLGQEVKQLKTLVQKRQSFSFHS